MANSFVSIKTSYNNALFFRDRMTDQNSGYVGYVFLGGHVPIGEFDTEIPQIENSINGEKSIWNGMYVAKKIDYTDIFLVIPRRNWVSGTIYKQYDDEVPSEDLLSTTGLYKPMYVITSELNVYKCLHNNGNSPSTNMPTGNFNTFNGFIETSDGYLWKYMYNIRPTNKFLTLNWMPAPSSYLQTDLASSSNNILDDIIASVVVTSNGSGYVNSILKTTLPYESGCTIITLDSVTNLVENMGISGDGIVLGSYITGVDFTYNKVSISSPTYDSSPANSTIQCFTRVNIIGDGNDDAFFRANLEDTKIKSISMVTMGTNYTFANVQIAGTGFGAKARVVFSPKYGHGYNPAKELGAKTIFINKTIGQVDATEGGVISTNTSFRQYGLLLNPHEFAQNKSVVFANANTIISQTVDVNLLPGSPFVLNEFVYQGSQVTGPFSGFVYDQTDNKVRLTNVKGRPVPGSLLIGKTSLSLRNVISYKDPDLQPYSGDILFVENIKKVDRDVDQAENIRIFLEF